MKKLLALLLAALMIVSCIFVLSSCNDDEQPGENNENENNEQNNNDNESVKNFGGRTFTILAKGPDFGAWEAVDIYAEAENCDRINDAVYKRNANVEQKYGVKIAQIAGGSNTQEEAYNQIASGTAEFDVISWKYDMMTYLAQNNQLLNLYDIEYLNLDQPWWDQNANAGLSIGEALYFTCSDLILSDLDGTWFLTFNKQIIEDKQLENPYQLVYDDEWTWDKYLEMAKLGSADLNGDDRRDEKDQYGISTEPFDSLAMFYAAGCAISSKDEDNYPEISVYNDYSVQVVEKIVEMVNDTNTYTTKLGIGKFATTGQALFGPTTVKSMRLNYNNMKEEFGVLPVPKFNEDQDRYYHLVSLQGSVAVPKTVTDYEFVGTILEALTEESSKVLIPEYYNEVLENRYLRDDESRDMLKIIFDTRAYDIAYLYNWGNFMRYLQGIDAGATNNFASNYDSNIDSATAKLEEVVDLYRGME